jgi:hypothetical protein
MELTTYLILLGISITLIVSSIIWCSQLPIVLHAIILILGVFSTFILFCFGLSSNNGRKIEIKEGKYQQIEDTIVVVVKGWPAVTTNDIQFLDTPLAVQQTINYNVWGMELDTEYEVVKYEEVEK